MAVSTVEQYDAPIDVDAEVGALAERISADGLRLPLAAPALDEAAARAAARAAVAQLVDKQALDALLAQVKGDGLRLTGPGGFLSELVRAVLERGLQAELTEHLGYGRHDPAGHGSGNSRNGATAKTVQTEVGPVEVKVPRDRAGTFTPMLVPKNARRLGGLSDVIISLYAGGMTVRDVAHPLGRGRLPRPRPPPPPAPCLWHRGVRGHHFHHHRRGPRGSQGLAAPPLGRGVPDRVCGLPHGQGP
jgi:hypothetical protein